MVNKKGVKSILSDFSAVLISTFKLTTHPSRRRDFAPCFFPSSFVDSFKSFFECLFFTKEAASSKKKVPEQFKFFGSGSVTGSLDALGKKG